MIAFCDGRPQGLDIVLWYKDLLKSTFYILRLCRADLTP